MTKYNNKKTEIDGILFDSKKEASRYLMLKQMQIDGSIKDLSLQPKYIVPSTPITGDENIESPV